MGRKYTRKIYRWGRKGYAALHPGRIIPKDWNWVEIEVVEEGEGYQVWKVRKIA